MFHVKHLHSLILILIFLQGAVSFGQGSIELEDKPFVIKIIRDDSLDTWLEASSVYNEMAKPDKDMIYWVNIMRKDTRAFFEKYVAEFIRQYPESGGGNANSLKRDLDKAGKLQLMKPSAILQKEAFSHASDVARNMKRLSHESSSGKSFQQRMKDRGITECAGENIYEGKQDALRAVILLLIDQGVPGVGHRKALLENHFNLMGTASVLKGGRNYIIVQDFSCE
jgi:Cysteine-rich secretory protein family